MKPYWGCLFGHAWEQVAREALNPPPPPPSEVRLAVARAYGQGRIRGHVTAYLYEQCSRCQSRRRTEERAPDTLIWEKGGPLPPEATA